MNIESAQRVAEDHHCMVGDVACRNAEGRRGSPLHRETNIQVLDAQRAAGDHHCAEDDDERR